jgi:hypothetical protein
METMNPNCKILCFWEADYLIKKINMYFHKYKKFVLVLLLATFVFVFYKIHAYYNSIYTVDILQFNHARVELDNLVQNYHMLKDTSSLNCDNLDTIINNSSSNLYCMESAIISIDGETKDAKNIISNMRISFSPLQQNLRINKILFSADNTKKFDEIFATITELELKLWGNEKMGPVIVKFDFKRETIDSINQLINTLRGQIGEIK